MKMCAGSFMVFYETAVNIFYKNFILLRKSGLA